MAIRGYFEPRPFGLVTVSIPGGLAGNGISAQGPVLEGRMSVEEAMVMDWIQGRRNPAEAGARLEAELSATGACNPARRW